MNCVRSKNFGINAVARTVNERGKDSNNNNNEKKTNVITAYLMDIIKVMASVKLIYVVFGSFCLSLKKKVF